MALMGCLAGFDGSYMLRVAVFCHTCLLDGQEASWVCVLQGLKTTAYWGMLLSGTTSSSMLVAVSDGAWLAQGLGEASGPENWWLLRLVP
jgi:hypothetical protein